MDESKPESILKIRPTGFDYELDAGCEKKRDVKDDFQVSGLKLEEWHCHYLSWNQI